jgi:hypothetical protein
VSDIVPQPQATLSSGQYTVAEAVNQKIIWQNNPFSCSNTWVLLF